jgi:hypothetical protein
VKYVCPVKWPWKNERKKRKKIRRKRPKKNLAKKREESKKDRKRKKKAKAQQKKIKSLYKFHGINDEDDLHYRLQKALKFILFISDVT